LFFYETRRIHPIGELNNDVKFKDLYDYMNCLQISPCTGWLTSNDTLRDLTSQVIVISSGAKRVYVFCNTHFFQCFYKVCTGSISFPFTFWHF